MKKILLGITLLLGVSTTYLLVVLSAAKPEVVVGRSEIATVNTYETKKADLEKSLASSQADQALKERTIEFVEDLDKIMSEDELLDNGVEYQNNDIPSEIADIEDQLRSDYESVGLSYEEANVEIEKMLTVEEITDPELAEIMNNIDKDI